MIHTFNYKETLKEVINKITAILNTEYKYIAHKTIYKDLEANGSFSSRISSYFGNTETYKSPSDIYEIRRHWSNPIEDYATHLFVCYRQSDNNILLEITANASSNTQIVVLSLLSEYDQNETRRNNILDEITSNANLDRDGDRYRVQLTLNEDKLNELNNKLSNNEEIINMISLLGI